jgi:hypothetical protein
MMLDQTIQRFITERHVDTFGNSKLGSNGIMLNFTLNYYDTYALLAITKKNIEYLNEAVMKEVKIHKGKLYFHISYSPKKDKFELEGIIYGVPLHKCIRVVSAVKRILASYHVGSEITSFSQNKESYTSVTLIKFR